MPSESKLHEQARAAIRSGKLAARRPYRTWGGPGIGAACSVCGRPVTADELEVEIQCVRGGSDPCLDRFQVHVRCFAEWELERGKV
jgi:hypothetical protein